MEKKKVANFKIEPSIWDEFLINCRRRNSDAAKQIRNFINNYNTESSNLSLLAREKVVVDPQ